MSRARFYGAVLIAAVLLSPLGAMAQSPVGQILGTVHDPSGAVVVGATVTVTNVETGQEFKTTTNQAGDYLVRDLPPGSYAVIASSSGFADVALSLTLVAFQNARVDLTLQVGGTSETVTVSAAPPQVDTRSNTLGALVDNRLITEMPIANRNIIETVNYTPGVGHVSPGNNVNRAQQR